MRQVGATGFCSDATVAAGHVSQCRNLTVDWNAMTTVSTAADGFHGTCDPLVPARSLEEPGEEDPC